MRDSLIFYYSFAKAIQRLPDDQQLKALWAIINYGLDGVEPEDDGELYMSIFDMAKPQIDANVKRKVNGAKGGRPSEEEEKEPEEIGPVAGSFKLNDGSLYDVTEDALANLQKLYPGVNGKQELNKIIGWAEANPTLRKTRRGAPRFLNSWFSRAQDQSSKKGQKQTKQNAFINFDQRDTDYDSMVQNNVKEWINE
jgi:hypothetical protein